MTQLQKHRVIALVLGLSAAAIAHAGTTMKNDADEKLNRELALSAMTQLYTARHDTRSAQAMTQLAALQAKLTATTLPVATFNQLKAVLHAPVDQLVIARAEAILISQHRKGQLTPAQVKESQLEARRLFTHKGEVARVAAYKLSEELGDRTALPPLSTRAAHDPNPVAKMAATKALHRLKDAAK